MNVRSAHIDATGAYRYTLQRRWGDRAGGVTWIMLNPSTADAERDDPTIRRCIGFTQRLGFDALVVVNLFALRATDPRELIKAADPIGPDNGEWVHKACHQAGVIIAAWGLVPMSLMEHEREIVPLINAEYKLKCLGVTTGGAPRHPLYLAKNAPLIDWPVAA